MMSRLQMSVAQMSAVIRKRTLTGPPWGSAEFVHRLEKTAQRHLAPQKPGPEKRSLRIEASLNLHSNLSAHLFPQSERPRNFPWPSLAGANPRPFRGSMI